MLEKSSPHTRRNTTFAKKHYKQGPTLSECRPSSIFAPAMGEPTPAQTSKRYPTPTNTHPAPTNTRHRIDHSITTVQTCYVPNAHKTPQPGTRPKYETACFTFAQTHAGKNGSQNQNTLYRGQCQIPRKQNKVHIFSNILTYPSTRTISNGKLPYEN